MIFVPDLESDVLWPFCNDAIGGKLYNNCVFRPRVVGGWTIQFIKATRDISAGEEILVNYGKKYWTEWGFGYKLK